jgi:tetratricopeptide (TPR) repeat protein
MALKDGKLMSNTLKDNGVRIIGLISKPDNMETVMKIMDDYEIDFPVLIDAERDVFSGYGIRVYPTTIIIDRDGKVAHSIPGHALNYKITLGAHLKYLLGEVDEEELKDMLSPRREAKDDSLLKAVRTYNLALKFTEAKLLDQAVDTVRKAIEIKPDIAKPYILLGFLLLAQEEADDALEQFNKALELDPQSHDAKTGLGGSLILKGDIDEAIEILTEASVANPYSEMTYYELGKAYELKGEESKSREMYKKALEKIIRNKILPSSIHK